MAGLFEREADKHCLGRGLSCVDCSRCCRESSSQIMASTSTSGTSRLGSFTSVFVSSDGQNSVEIGLDQLTPSSIARVFSVSHEKASQYQ